MKIYGTLIALLILITASVSGCLSNENGTNEPAATATATSAPVSSTGSSETRTNSEAGVTITAAYLGNYVFEVKLDTHSGSLDYDMAKVSFIRDGKGNVIKPESWDGGIGGHHFDGNLKFPEFDDSAGFELVIQDVAGVKERVLKW